jgi:hypothetical protein
LWWLFSLGSITSILSWVAGDVNLYSTWSTHAYTYHHVENVLRTFEVIILKKHKIARFLSNVVYSAMNSTLEI